MELFLDIIKFILKETIHQGQSISDQSYPTGSTQVTYYQNRVEWLELYRAIDLAG
jgi:hypothetical protein